MNYQSIPIKIQVKQLNFPTNKESINCFYQISEKINMSTILSFIE